MTITHVQRCEAMQLLQDMQTVLPGLAQDINAPLCVRLLRNGDCDDEMLAGMFSTEPAPVHLTDEYRNAVVSVLTDLSVVLPQLSQFLEVDEVLQELSTGNDNPVIIRHIFPTD